MSLSVFPKIVMQAGEATTTAAKVAAEMAAGIVTGGVVAETGPPPDFCLWTAEDDIQLKNAMEAGAAIEALAKGAVQFSQRYTVRELRERWRALLYDPVISMEASKRMLKSEALVTNAGKLSNLNKLKYPQVSNRKRKLKSVRFHYYNKKKGNISGNSSINAPERENEETTVKEEVEPCADGAFFQRDKLFVSDGPEILPEATFSVPVEEHQQSMMLSDGLLRVKVEGLTMPSLSGEGAMNELSIQQTSTGETVTGASTSESKPGHLMEQVTNTREGCAVSDSGSQERFTEPALENENKEIIDQNSKDAAIMIEKSLTVDIPSKDQMICILNTEDTEIPSPPSSSITHLSPFFSSKYSSLDLQSTKSEPGIIGGGYARASEFELSGHGLMRSVSEDRRAVGSLVKQEPMLDSLECDPQYRMKMQSSLSTSHSSSSDLIAHIRDKEALDLSENTGGHMVKDVQAMRRNTIASQDLDEGLESDDELPSFSDVEGMILDMDLDSAFDEDALARAESRRLYQRQRKTLLRLEQGARAALERTLTHRGAIAVLYGHHLRYYIRRNEVLLGRATLDNAVDIDLGKEGRANKVSRRQATIRLMEDGVFYLKNLGSRDLSVNNIIIPSGQHATIGSNCLIEVGGMRFIFEINRKLVKRRVEEMLQNRQQR
ncbi:hypothetical protein KP509_21G031100 [Ceratopteris richardii]|uniref:FHA domain-containing protein n=1 Tax=Ceratopteris richardii TaxID=49495 RepID=A0A8T2SBR4_CERRI|nr:hypothetical protein KP509_21G031100 [Ceratopteris richardii]KAH7315033.1 hypothetical protein KP509_21G031100 [Ceratopteris richardii]